MKHCIATVAAAASILLVPSARAQGPAATAPSRTTEQAARELVEVTGAAKMGSQVLAQMIPALRQAVPDAPADFWAEFSAEVKPDEIMDRVIPIYAKHFSLEELEQLLVFYRSPLGQKVIGEMPAVVSESMTVGQEWGRQIGERAIRKLEERRSKTPPKP